MQQAEQPTKKLGPTDYCGQPINCCQGQQFQPWNRRGFTSIEVLQFLYGKPWDDTALGFAHATRPSIIRVVDDGCVQCDARTWRLTVFLDKNKLIERISQEVQVGLPDDCEHGAALNRRLKC